MSQDDLFGAPAGWYPDPLGLPQLRWWNNHAWTEQTAAARQPMVVQDTKFAWADDEPEAAPATDSAGAATLTDDAAATAESLRQLESPFGDADPADPFAAAPTAPAASNEPANPYAESAKWWETRGTDTRRAASAASAAASAPAEPVANPFMQPVSTPAPAAAETNSSFSTLFDQSTPAAPASTFAANADSLQALFGAPVAPRSRARTPIVSSDLFEAAGTTVAAAKSVNTIPGWVLAALPVLQLLVGVLLINALGEGINVVVYDGVFVLAYLAGPALAFVDRRLLLQAGFERPAHWAWAFLTPFVYLLLRARATLRESGHGVGPALVWLGLAVLQLVSVVAVPGQLIAAAPAVFADQIEQSVESTAASVAGAQLTLECPPTPPVLIGEEIECTSVTPGGATYKVVVALTRSNGWIGWQVIDWGKFTL
ncbi:DUF2510 domain-containing protein [Galbitalea sp. SE-J8]|uniref:DUF2510 domain-containing protein n=1 Tax=Galbitalea sp. SE-J8 TaxID=3054952 RepID=UPI00259CD88E|nr:DUF2510 domain-containing protein [Galbitalea sp. SE-J8]MDM4762615.1 DUF2510 domain-containing protein [Galbitalea sp. SE-J8]